LDAGPVSSSINNPLVVFKRTIDVEGTVVFRG